MNNTFDICINRNNTGSAKWDLIKKEFNKDNLIGMRIADTDFAAPQNILDALIKRLSHPVLGYGYPTSSQLFNISNFYSKIGNFHFKTSDIAMSPGIMPVISTAILTFTKEGDEVIIQSPTYPPFIDTILGNQRSILENPLKYNKNTGEYTFDFQDLEKKISPRTKIWVLCSPHNPTGRVFTKEELLKVGEICLKNNIIIVSDEIHGYLNFQENPYIPIASLSKEIANITITTASPGKLFDIAGLVYAFAIITNPCLKEAFDNKSKALGTCFAERNSIGIVASEAAYKEENIEWIKSKMIYIKKNYDYLYSFMKKNLPDVVITPSNGTFLVWANFNGLEKDPSVIEKELIEKAGIVLLNGNKFGKDYSGFFRINIGCCHNILKLSLEKIKSIF